MAESATGCVEPVNGEAMVRKRVRLELTVHPLTDRRLKELTERFAKSKGAVVDQLVQVLYTAYQTKKQYCIIGRPCRIELTDLPDVF